MLYAELQCHFDTLVLFKMSRREVSSVIELNSKWNKSNQNLTDLEFPESESPKKIKRLLYHPAVTSNTEIHRQRSIVYLSEVVQSSNRIEYQSSWVKN
ncbi:hypothetical protein NPIL_564401 [Nephila pilipes]|uniref:Uncharacterized protein n=1 Tax=Nephila pilipes TaxID=299642 RepID=A0A8X6PQZ4_NEPPI|nr:hypothetical protein NPIL_564401 [Nephila pilipes]